MEELNMTYNTINTNNVQPEIDFEEIQKDLDKFKRNVGLAYKRRGYPFQVGVPDRGG